MTKIALISDTHGHLDPKLFKYLDACDEVWHAGDIGNLETFDRLNNAYKLRSVYGNIDGHEVRNCAPFYAEFHCEQVKVLITHIAGKPGRYNKKIVPMLYASKPQVFVCGHSHILHVQYDKHFNFLHLNPGACGIHGFHKVKTLLRFEIDGRNIQNMEIVELGPRA